MDPCCSGGTQQPELNPDDMWDDPTLQHCCRRDLKHQRRGSEIKARLQSADRVDARTKLQDSAIGSDACAQEETASLDQGDILPVNEYKHALCH
jgi:hypothetical protein